MLVMRSAGRKSVKQRCEIECDEDGVRMWKRAARIPYESVRRTERQARNEERRDVVRALELMWEMSMRRRGVGGSVDNAIGAGGHVGLRESFGGWGWLKVGWNWSCVQFPGLVCCKVEVNLEVTLHDVGI